LSTPSGTHSIPCALPVLWSMLERLVLSCLVLSCLVLSCPVLSCPVLFCLGIGIGIGLSLRGMSSELQTHAKLMHVSHECSDFVQSERNVDMSNLQRAPSYQQYCYVATAHLMSRNFVCCFSTMTNGCIQCPTVQCRPACSVLPVCSLPVGYTLCFFADDRHGQDFSWLEASDQHLTFFRKSGRHTAPINSQTSNCTTISVQRVVSGFAPITTPASHFHPSSCKLLIITGAVTAASMQIGAHIYLTCTQQNVTCHVRS